MSDEITCPHCGGIGETLSPEFHLEVCGWCDGRQTVDKPDAELLDVLAKQPPRPKKINKPTVKETLAKISRIFAQKKRRS